MQACCVALRPTAAKISGSTELCFEVFLPSNGLLKMASAQMVVEVMFIDQFFRRSADSWQNLCRAWLVVNTWILLLSRTIGNGRVGLDMQVFSLQHASIPPRLRAFCKALHRGDRVIAAGALIVLRCGWFGCSPAKDVRLRGA